ncbi:MAG TPA: FHA domain-containing protein [Polyangiaceae bacterium]|nr:FHA domain-containing protein [Polyangiaceae bacterium]
MWLLTIEDDEGLTTFHRLTRDRYTIGRGPGSDLVLAQLDVSREHACLERREGAWLLADKSSRGGSFLNGMRLRGSAPLEDGDVAQIGGYLLRFSRSVPTGLPTPPPRYVAPARLRALAGPLAGEEHVFARNEIVTLGASDDCTLRLVHDRVSAVHAHILPAPGGRHELVDKSHRGVLLVNGRQVAGRHLLEGGDAVNVGGVALFRYLEPSQQPDPRFDAVWADGAAPPPPEPPCASTPSLRAARPSAGRAAPGPGATEGAGESDARVEAVGPRPVPAQAAPSTSYERLRRATMGRGDAAGGERAFVVDARGASGAGAFLRGYAGSARGAGGVGPGSGAPEPLPPSGRSLYAITTPVDPAREGAIDVEDEVGQREDAPPQADAESRVRRRWSALALPVAAALAVGATVGLQAPLPGLPRSVLGASPPGADVEAAPSAVAPVVAALARGVDPDPVVAAPPTAPLASAEPPSATGARSNEGAPKRSGRLAYLTARARSGRASGDELREMLSLSLDVGDASRAAEARSYLQGARRGP